MDINVYNYCCSDEIVQPYRIEQDELMTIVERLISELHNNTIDTSRIRVVDGNKDRPDVAFLIEELLKYWKEKKGAGYKTPLIQCLYWSFSYLHQKSRGENLDSVVFWTSDDEQIKKDMAYYFNSNIRYEDMFNSVIATGSNYEIENINGDYFKQEYGCGGVSLNRCLLEKSIWHETAHLLGVDDHYGNTLKKCTDPSDCIMQYNANEGKWFCKAALEEISQTLKELN